MHRISENNCVSELGLHVVFCTKYRKAILTGTVGIAAKNILSQTCAEYGWRIESLEIMPEHVHLFIQVGPGDRPNEISRTLKSISAVYIFEKFPHLKGRRFWGSGLWSRGTYYGSVGNVSQETIKRYIEG